MVIRYEDLMGTYEQKRALVSQFNLMDDTFFSVVMRNKAACEYLLSALMHKTVSVIEHKTQYSIRNIESHSVVLDALVEDSEHNLYNVEVQKEDEGNHERRMRYNQTAVDWTYLEKSVNYSKLPELYMIFISEFDTFKLGRNNYSLSLYIDGTDTKCDDGIHRLYFNTAVDDGTDLSKLLQYMANSSAENNGFGALSQAVKHHKIINEGVDSMCKAVEEYANSRRLEGKLEGKIEGRLEGKLEDIKNMLKDGLPLEKALKYTGLDEATYKEHCQRMQ